MRITDATYYQTGIKFIPDVKVTGTPVQGVPTNNTVSKLEHFIDINERLLLLSFLNVDLYNEFELAIQDLQNADVKWLNLVEGTTYTKDGEKYIFDGLRGYSKDSLVAYFVFCEYIKNDNNYYSTSGVIQTKDKNAYRVDPSSKLMDCYYAFLNKYQDNYEDLEPCYYMSSTGLIGVDYAGSNDNGVVTLETFLRDNAADYEGYEFKRFETINSFGI
tara:strand:+ start:14068 stop:14718 length:651 start_codon:yes stop_codon:yes gene_type:complete